MKKIYSRILLLGMMLCMILLFDVKAYANPGDPLCFTAAEANVKIKLVKEGYPDEIYLETSENGLDWRDYSIGSEITLTNIDDTIYFRNTSAENKGFSNWFGRHYHFIITGKVNCSGDVTTLLRTNGNVLDLTGYIYCFTQLFSECDSLLSAPELPVTTLSDYCFYYMFYECSSLVEPPELPATNLAEYCYCGMFLQCHSLETTPELPAKTLTHHCYDTMFGFCESLKKAPELPATTLAECCYHAMFAECTSLEKAPELPATTLAYGCYELMFRKCTSLKIIKVRFTDWQEDLNPTRDWLQDTPTKGTLFCPKTLQRKDGDSFILPAWSSIDAYIVSFDSNGYDIPLKSQLVISREYIGYPGVLVNGDKVCYDWYKEPACINKWNFNIDVPTSDITLYAKWEDINNSGSTPANPLYGGVYLINSGTTTLTKKDTKAQLDDSVSACYFYDVTNKKLYVKYIDGTAPDPVYITKTKTVHDTKDVIKEVEKIVNPQTITIVDEKGNKKEAIIKSDGTYTIIDSNIPVSTYTEKELQELKELEERKELLRTYPSKGIKLVIGLSECIIDGKKMTLDAPAEVIEGRTYLPIRLIAEYLGATVSWDEKTPDKVEIIKGSKKIILTIGSKIAKVNNKEYELEYPCYTKYDRTYLPVRFISEHLGANVEWNENSPYEIIIK